MEDSWMLMDGLWGRRPLRSKEGRPLVEQEDIEREMHARNHDVWYHQTRLNMLVPKSVRAAALNLTQKIYDATFHADEVTSGLWHYINPAQVSFLEVARKDLGIEEIVVHEREDAASK